MKSSADGFTSELSQAEVGKLKERLAVLENQIKRYPKLEESKKKLELEVAYWKEYVTKRDSRDHPGTDRETARRDSTTIVDLQSELEQTQQKMSLSQSRVSAQNKEIADLKSWSQEAATMLAVHKATAETLRKELENCQRNGTKDLSNARIEGLEGDVVIAERTSGGAKFSAVKNKLQQIERELHQKSKELEKANESRGKVAKYTRSLLQELEVKLNDTQRRSIEWEEKALMEQKNARMEQHLRSALENELEELKEQMAQNEVSNDGSGKGRAAHSGSKKDMEVLLQEKDAQLRFSEDVIKQLQISLKKVAGQQQSSEQLQVKLSEATHKVSESHLKIHMLTKQVEELKPLERQYLAKVEECHGYQSTITELNSSIFGLKNKIEDLQKELEMQSIKEVVLKEQLIAYEYDSSCESDDNDEAIEKQKTLREEIDRKVNEETIIKREELLGKGNAHILIARLECAEKESALKGKQLLDSQNELCTLNATVLSLQNDLADANDVLAVQNESLAEKSEECAEKTLEMKSLQDRLALSAKAGSVVIGDSVDGKLISAGLHAGKSEQANQDVGSGGIEDQFDSARMLASLIKSERQVVDLFESLEKESKMRIQMEVSLIQMERKTNEISAQLEQANKSLNLKVEELDKERHNVIHLVDVTGVYVKELEDALQQSRNKVQTLISSVNSPSSHLSGDISSSSEVMLQAGKKDPSKSKEDNNKYVTRIAMLESQVSTLSSMYDSRPLEESKQSDAPSTKDQLISSQTTSNADQECLLCKDRADLLDRVQELELELEESRNVFELHLQEKENEYRRNKASLEEELIHMTQLSYSNKPDDLEKRMFETLNQKIKELEDELHEIHLKHDQEMSIEKESHQKEMEETIRDMLLIKNSLDSSCLHQADESVDGRLSSRRSSMSLDDSTEHKYEYERKVASLKEFHAQQLQQCNRDMESVLESLGYGNPGNVIVNLTSENRSLENQLHEIKDEYDRERRHLQLALDKAENASYTALTRNEEMAAKVFQMQTELEEMEKGEKTNAASHEQLAQLTARNKELESQLTALRAERDRLAARKNEDRGGNGTDKSTLALSQLTNDITRQKLMLKQSEEKHRLEIERLTSLNKDLRDECKQLNARVPATTKPQQRQPDLGDDRYSDRAVEEILNSEPLANYKQWMENLLAKKQSYFDGQIAQIRMEYEEKLKECMKENMRRISQSERKTESQRVKEANRKISNLETELMTAALDHEKELADCKAEIARLKSVSVSGAPADVPAEKPHDTAPVETASISSSKEADQGSTVTTDAKQSEEQIQRLEEQIVRYEKRVDYYKEKAQRENCAESQRVGELKDEISELQSAMQELKGESQNKYRRTKSEVSDKIRYRHCSDGVQLETAKANQPLKKRWSSDLQGRQDTIVNKIGALNDKRNQKLMIDVQKEDVGKSVAARKAIWENIDRC